eukprot:15154172-Alexandrium_andersonii.AAC.1
MAQTAPLESSEDPRSSRFERLMRLGILRMADYELRRSAALTGSVRIAECTLGTSRCKDTSHSSWE